MWCGWLSRLHQYLFRIEVDCFFFTFKTLACFLFFSFRENHWILWPNLLSNEQNYTITQQRFSYLFGGNEIIRIRNFILIYKLWKHFKYFFIFRKVSSSRTGFQATPASSYQFPVSLWIIKPKVNNQSCLWKPSNNRREFQVEVDQFDPNFKLK